MSDLPEILAPTGPAATAPDRQPARLPPGSEDVPEYEPFLMALPERIADTGGPGVSRATLIMMAAANVNTRKLHAQFRERDEYPFRADTGEYGLDIKRVRQELELARKRMFLRDAALVCIVLFGVTTLDDPTPVRGVLLFLALTLVVFAHRLAASARVRRLFRQGARDEATYLAHDDNVTISGGYSPFVGSGAEISGWSFTVNAARPDNEMREVQPLAVADLYRETDEALRKLGIHGLELRDELFIDGRDVRAVSAIFDNASPGKPKARLTQAELDDLVQGNSAKIRHYRVVRVQLWSGQIVLSVFLKYTKLADTLFVETRMRVLPPLHEKFAAYESLPVTGSVRRVLKDFALSTLAAPVAWIPPIAAVMHWIFGGFLEFLSSPESRSRKAIGNDRRYNFGWPKSLRETWASDSYERYFQMVDNDFHTKMIKETLLDGLVESLEKRNICTKTLNEATTKIFNDGLIQTGGTINSTSLAIGKGAVSKINSFLSEKSTRSSSTQ